jgi:hypothetical protein
MAYWSRIVKEINGQSFSEDLKMRNGCPRISLAECFFAIDKDSISSLNAKGITTVLTFAGYNVMEASGY